MVALFTITLWFWCEQAWVKAGNVAVSTYRFIPRDLLPFAKYNEVCEYDIREPSSANCTCGPQPIGERNIIHRLVQHK